MRRRGSLFVGLLLVCPAAAAAQKVAPAKVVGEWAREGEKQPALILRADSTFTLFGKGTGPMGAPIQSDGRWRLAGDTLVTQGVKRDSPETRAALVKLKGRRLTVTALDKTSSRVYERFKASKP